MTPEQIARQSLNLSSAEEEYEEEGEEELQAQQLGIEEIANLALGGEVAEQEVAEQEVAEQEAAPQKDEAEGLPIVNFLKKAIKEIGGTAKDVAKTVPTALLTAPSGIPHTILETANLPGHLSYRPRETIKELTGWDLPFLENEKERASTLQRYKEKAFTSILGEKRGREVLAENEQTSQEFGEKAQMFEEVLRNAISATIGEGPTETIYEGLAQGQPYFKRNFEKALGLEENALEPTTDTGKLLDKVISGAINLRGIGVPLGAGGAGELVSGGLEQAGVPEEVYKPLSLVSMVFGGKAPKTPKPPRPKQAEILEAYKTDKVARDFLSPNIKIMETAESLGVELPPWMVGDSAAIDSAIYLTSKGPLSRRKFKKSIESVTSKVEEAFQKGLDEVADSSFEGPAELLGELEKSPRPIEEARKAEHAKLVKESEEQFKAEGMQAEEAKKAAEERATVLQEQIDSTNARMHANEIRFENPAQSVERIIFDGDLRTDYAVGNSIQDSLQTGVDTSKQVNRENYAAAEDLVPQIDVLAGEVLEPAQQALESLDTPGPKSTSTLRAIRVLNELIESISDGQGTLTGSGVRSMINNKINLNEIVNYDLIGTSLELVEGVNNSIRRLLARVGRDYPEWWDSFQNAERTYERNAEVWRNPTVKEARLGRPENITSTAMTPSSYFQLQDALLASENGAQLAQELKRQSFRKVVGADLVEAQTLAEASQKLSPAKREALFQFSPVFNSVEADVMRSTQNLTRELAAENLSLETTRKSVLTDLEKTQKEKVSEPKKKEVGEFKPSPLTLEMLKSVEGITKLREELNSTPQGKSLMKKLERFQTEELVGTSLYDTQGNIDFSKLLKTMNDRTSSELLKTLVGEKTFKDMKSVAQLGDTIIKKTKEATGKKSFAFPGGYFIFSLLNGNVVDAAFALGLKGAAKRFGVEFLTNPDNISLLSKIGREKSVLQNHKYFEKLGQNAIKQAEEFQDKKPE